MEEKMAVRSSKKGLGKDAMIEAMSQQDIDHHLIKILHDNPDYLKKKSNYGKYYFIEKKNGSVISWWNNTFCQDALFV